MPWIGACATVPRSARGAGTRSNASWSCCNVASLEPSLMTITSNSG